MQSLATPQSGDPSLTREEGAVLEQLLAYAGCISEQEIAEWFDPQQIVTWPSACREHAQALIVACEEDIERRAAIAIMLLTRREQRVLRALVIRHPHTYFEGFHEPVHLQRACALAALRSGSDVA